MRECPYCKEPLFQDIYFLSLRCATCGRRWDGRTLREIPMPGEKKERERVFLTSYLVGWRDWRLDAGGRLRSRNTFHHSDECIWPIKEPMRSRCGHLYGPPSIECGNCGIHAHKTQEQLFAIAKRPEVWGRIALWGVVVEFEEGYQAEYAYPIELFSTCLVAGLGVYGVPITLKPHEPPKPPKPKYGMWEVRHGSKIKVEILRTHRAGQVYGRQMVEVKLERPGGGADVIRVAADKVTEISD